jgi:hypothetical protein
MRVFWLCVAAVALIPSLAHAATVYQTAADNSLPDLIAGNSFAAYGDQINLEGTARQITSIAIPFTLFNDTSDPSTTATPYTPNLTLTLYKNDGTVTSSHDAIDNGDPALGGITRPGTAIASSTVSNVTLQALYPINDTQTFTFSFSNALVPSTFSFLVTQNNQDGSIDANQLMIGESDVGGAEGPGTGHPILHGSHNGYVWVQNDSNGLFEATEYGYPPSAGPGYLAISATVTAVTASSCIAAGNWSATGSWTTTGVPGQAGDTASFVNALGSTATVTLDTNKTVGHLIFNNSSTAYTIASTGGSTLTLDNSGAGNSGPATIEVDAGSHTISAPLMVPNGATVTTAASTSLTLNGPLSIGGTMRVSGGGTIAIGSASLSLANNSQLMATGSGSTLRLNAGSATSGSLGTGITAVVSAGATLELANSAPVTPLPVAYRVAVTNSGVLQIDAGAAQQMGGIDGNNHDAPGGVVLQGGAQLTADHINQSSLVISAGATFTLAPSSATGSPMDDASGFALAGSLTPANAFIAADGSLIFGGGFEGSAAALNVGSASVSGAAAVPEPSTLALLAIAAIGLAARRPRPSWM